MLAGQKEKRDIPHEDGQWMEFQTLSGKQMEDAQAAEVKKQLSLVRDIGQDTLQAVRSANPGTVERDPVSDYDKEFLVRYGVTAWSYDAPCNDENKEKLDSATRDWAAGVIVEINTRTPGEATGSSVNSNGASSHSNSVEPIVSLRTG